MSPDDVVDWEMARFLSRKTGAERLAIAARMFRTSRQVIDHQLQAEHPDWDFGRRGGEIAKRLAHGNVPMGQDELLRKVLEEETEDDAGE